MAAAADVEDVALELASPRRTCAGRRNQLRLLSLDPDNFYMVAKDDLGANKSALFHYSVPNARWRCVARSDNNVGILALLAVRDSSHLLLYAFVRYATGERVGLFDFNVRSHQRTLLCETEYSVILDQTILISPRIARGSDWSKRQQLAENDSKEGMSSSDSMSHIIALGGSDAFYFLMCDFDFDAKFLYRLDCSNGTFERIHRMADDMIRNCVLVFDFQLNALWMIGCEKFKYRKLHTFDLANCQWKARAIASSTGRNDDDTGYPQPRVNCATAAFDAEFVYVVGGENPISGDKFDDIWRLSLREQRWQKLELHLPEPTAGLSVCVCDNGLMSAYPWRQSPTCNQETLLVELWLTTNGVAPLSEICWRAFRKASSLALAQKRNVQEELKNLGIPTKFIKRLIC